MPHPVDLLARRLSVQRLTGTPFSTAQEAVRFFGAVQAQDHPGAKWSLGMRVRNATDAILDAALAAGKIIRTHVLRPTWHFVAPEDLHWMLALSAPQVNRLGSYQYQELELGPKLFAKVHRLLVRGLAGGRHLTRAEVARELERGGIVGDGRRIAHILMESELAGVVCSGAPKGKQQTYALVEEWVTRGPRYTRADAVVALAQRFFTSHGPATMKQFAWWSGLTLTEARTGREALKKVESEELRGVEWIWPESRSTNSQKPTALLIPEYDEVLTGWADIGIPRTMADRRRGKPTNTFDRPILYGGKWVGTWRRTIGPKRVVIEIERFGKHSPAIEKALRTEAERYAAFLRMPVALV